jgi:lambda repressor-like predicted transcriptional regulator
MLKNKIKSQLALQGLTMRKLAEHMGITSSELTNLLKRDMKMSSALKLATSHYALTGHQLTLGDFK